MDHKTLAALAVGLAGVAGFTYPQEGKTTEQEYKHIESFKGIPAGELLPAMRFMSASLGVKCVFCHNTEDFPSEEKPQKQRARQMIAMQRQIDRAFFAGQGEVTCTSCHNGHTSPARRPSLTGLVLRHTMPTTEMPTDDVFSKFLKARGATLKSISLSGVSVHAGRPDSAYELLETETGKFALTAGLNRFVCDGSSVWRVGENGAEPAPGDSGDIVRRTVRLFLGASPFGAYEKPFVAGFEKIDGRDTVVVRGRIPADKVLEDLYFDKETGLLARVATQRETVLGSLPSFMDYGDYRLVDGMMTPFKIVVTSPDGEATTTNFATAKGNVEVPDAAFKPPH
ncbi:MAG: photosynthetic reaction center cytochrome c subunit [Fimbriimonas ginsengisoli]|uniref:Photosynthetic reaction center cytochrome c subunit n=1 Tax=Fimbriimonas ginsengisoli TaxID=1005039 RepID=A0A931PTB8_FIMGI|nr:photosynthetic reaction center cytochrome c subunit [Fimbriimonas ginsengisoli]